MWWHWWRIALWIILLHRGCRRRFEPLQLCYQSLDGNLVRAERSNPASCQFRAALAARLIKNTNLICKFLLGHVKAMSTTAFFAAWPSASLTNDFACSNTAFAQMVKAWASVAAG